MREVYEWKCLLCGIYKFEAIDKHSNHLELTHWDPAKPLTINNVVPMYGKCVKAHQLKKELNYDESVLKKKDLMDVKLALVLAEKKVIFKS